VKLRLWVTSALLSLVCFTSAGFLIYERFYPLSPVFAAASSEKSTASASVPVNLKISALGIDLPVVAARSVSGRFPTTREGITYLKDSSLPGEPAGVAVFYGHNWPRLLGNLKEIQVGQTITLGLQDSEITYRVDSIVVVSPSEASVLSPVPDWAGRLILYTCSGFLDSRRLVVTATAI